jgi:hypothetical protein
MKPAGTSTVIPAVAGRTVLDMVRNLPDIGKLDDHIVDLRLRRSQRIDHQADGIGAFLLTRELVEREIDLGVRGADDHWRTNAIDHLRLRNRDGQLHGGAVLPVRITETRGIPRVPGGNGRLFRVDVHSIGVIAVRGVSVRDRGSGSVIDDQISTCRHGVLFL